MEVPLYTIFSLHRSGVALHLNVSHKTQMKKKQLLSLQSEYIFIITGLDIKKGCLGSQHWNFFFFAVLERKKGEKIPLHFFKFLFYNFFFFIDSQKSVPYRGIKQD